MGIPGFYGHFLENYVKTAVINGLPPFVASLAFDLNGVFHDARKIVFGEGDKDPRLLQAIADTDPNLLELQLYNTVGTIILRMVQAAQPRDCLILAVDGVAPGAKMQQQRGRREKAAKDKSAIETFDRNAITPGTEFMMRLNSYIIRFISTYRKQLPPKVIYSSHLVPGEGEHKIMEYYRKGEASDGAAAKQGGSHILYGLDADLIMLSLLSPLNNIYLSRETVRKTVSIDKFREYIQQNGKRPTAIDDFVVMMFLIGNDFLPHIPSLEEMSESINMLLNIYAAGNYVLTKVNEKGRRSINWEDTKTFVQTIAIQENELLAALSTKEYEYPSRFLQSALIEGQFYPDIFRSTWYQNALGAKGPKEFTDALIQIIGGYVPTEADYINNSENAQKLITTISAITPDRIETMVMDYMRTMEWTYLYYLEGTAAINHDWAYPYYHTPMLVDLSAVMQTIGTTREISGYEAYEGMIPFNALQQLVAVLPMKSRDLIPIELQPLFSYNSIIRDLFPDNFIVELDGKHKEHQGIPIVPLIDRQRIIEAVAQISFTPERLKLWLPEKDEFFVRTPDEEELLAQSQYNQRRHEEFLNRQSRRFKPDGQSTRTHFNDKGLIPTMGQLSKSRGGGRGRAGRGGRATQSYGEDRGGMTRGYRGGYQRDNQAEIRRPPTRPATSNLLIPKPTQPAPRPPTAFVGKGPTIAPTGTKLPVGLQVGKGPTLAPAGTKLPVGLQVGKGPTLAPAGTKLPVGLQVGKGPAPTGLQVGKSVPKTPVTPTGLQVGKSVPKTPVTPTVIPVTQPTQNTVRSPAQWKQMENLM